MISHENMPQGLVFTIFIVLKLEDDVFTGTLWFAITLVHVNNIVYTKQGRWTTDFVMSKDINLPGQQIELLPVR